jgi:hypothetical protein
VSPGGARLAALLLALAPWAGPALEPGATPAQVRAEMARIRRATDWNDPAAARAATEEIDRLARQLSAAGGAGGSPAAGTQADLAEQVHRSVRQGKDAPIDLSRKAREEVEQELKDEEDEGGGAPSAAALAILDLLVIDFSRPGWEVLVAQLDRCTAVRTLVLTGGEGGAPVDLEAVLTKAAALPLEALYVINFRGHVAALPERVAGFRTLTRLGAFNNALAALPPGLAGLRNLEVLYLDVNPLATVLPAVAGLPGLRELGLARTRVSAGEVARLRQLLPSCKVLLQ